MPVNGNVPARQYEGHASPASVVEDWMESVPHRNVLLGDEYVLIGVGLHIDSSTEELYWVLWFAGEPIYGCRSNAHVGRSAEHDSQP